jgi:hypothetical protein
MVVRDMRIEKLSGAKPAVSEKPSRVGTERSLNFAFKLAQRAGFRQNGAAAHPRFNRHPDLSN